jgi:hypothetical protein
MQTQWFAFFLFKKYPATENKISSGSLNTNRFYTFVAVFNIVYVTSTRNKIPR